MNKGLVRGRSGQASGDEGESEKQLGEHVDLAVGCSFLGLKARYIAAYIGNSGAGSLVPSYERNHVETNIQLNSRDGGVHQVPRREASSNLGENAACCRGHMRSLVFTSTHILLDVTPCAASGIVGALVNSHRSEEERISIFARSHMTTFNGCPRT